MSPDPATIEAAIGAAIAAGEELGLDTTEARAAAAAIVRRSGFPSDIYVLALAGGTGVGKSSLLNAIAGEQVSASGVQRPTTSIPVVWLPASRRDEAAPLLEWLGSMEVRTRDRDGPAVAIVDLPDLDSIEPRHAARVDDILPRIDAVLWVTDPEKYDDAVLHDGYLARWMPRLARQAIVINKLDRLEGDDGLRIQEDLRGRLAAEGLPEVPVLLASARHAVEPVAAWLREGAEAKEVIRARMRAAALDTIRSLAARAGVEAGEAPPPLVTTEVRARALTASSRALLRIIDLEGLRRQAVAATATKARAVGGGPLGSLRTLVGRGSGSPQQRADPEGYLRRWRERGSLDPAVAPIRALLTAALATLPPEARPGLARLAEREILEERLARGVDRVVTAPSMRLQEPESRLWSWLGAAQLLATAALVVGLVWQVVLVVGGSAVPSPVLELPGLGPMPTPAVLILAGLFGWLVIGRLLGWHAGRLGDRWADRLSEALRGETASVLDDTLGEPLSRVDEARRRLWAAQHSIEGIDRGAPAAAPGTEPEGRGTHESSPAWRGTGGARLTGGGGQADRPGP